MFGCPIFKIMLKISSIERSSVAARVGLKKDDVIVAFDGEQAIDMLDAAYFDSQSNFTLTVKRGENELTFPVKKNVNLPMGW